MKKKFTRTDLEQLDVLLYSRADRVVPMRDVWAGDTGPNVIGLRHDVDDNHGGMAFETALRMGEWEASRGYRSTYYLLHGSRYWHRISRAAELEEMGHEVGLHVNGIAEGLKQRRDPVEIVREALEDLRQYVRVEGCAAHGDERCKDKRGNLVFVNDEMFVESARPKVGEPDRLIVSGVESLRLRPVPRGSLGLLYDAAWLRRGLYLSDSGSEWSQSPKVIAGRFGEGQLHMLVHPDWWSRAFVPERLAA